MKILLLLSIFVCSHSAYHRGEQRKLATAGTKVFTGAMTDTGCYKPKSAGGWGYCGPASCQNQYITCPSENGGPATVDGVTGTYTNNGGSHSATNCESFLPRTTDSDATDFRPRGPCTSCTQQTTGVCSATFLTNVITGDGVKTAYCNDKWLVVTSTARETRCLHG
jgi:hypothetical protein